MNGLGRKENKNKEKEPIFTKETLGVVIALFSALALVLVITRDSIFAEPGLYINAFFLGLFGFFTYAVLIWTFMLGVKLIIGKNFPFSVKTKIFLTLCFSSLTMLIHTATISAHGLTYGEYLSLCYTTASGGIEFATGGGLATGLIAYWLSSLLTDVGCYILLSLALVVGVYFTIKNISESPIVSARKKPKINSSYVKDESNEKPEENLIDEQEPAQPVLKENTNFRQKLFVQNERDFSLKSRHEMNKTKDQPGIKVGFSAGGLGIVNHNNSAKQNSFIDPNDIKAKLDYIKQPIIIDKAKVEEIKRPIEQIRPFTNTVNTPTTTVSESIARYSPDREDDKGEIPFIEHEDDVFTDSDDSIKARADEFSRYVDNDEVGESASIVEEMSESITMSKEIEEQASDIIDRYQDISEQVEDEGDDFSQDEILEARQIQDEIEESVSPKEDIIEEQAPTSRVRDIFFGEKEEIEEAVNDSATNEPSFNRAQDRFSTRRAIFEPVENNQEKEQISSADEESKEEKKKEVVPINRHYYKPPLDLLESYSRPIDETSENHDERKQIIKDTLESFRISVEPQGHIQGPTVTRYEIMMPPGISVKKVLAYDEDLRMRLSARAGVRIEAPIPGKNLVGIEVANNEKVTVGLKEVMEGLAQKKTSPTGLYFALGKSIVGEAKGDDLAKGPHYLVAGSTGSGKSVCLHVMIVSLLLRYSPEELKFVLVDPKGVEFRKYEHMPHLLVDEIITEPKRAIALLQWAYEETTRRNNLFTACGGEISNIGDYNTKIANATTPKLPRIVFIIDELADLMESNKKDLEAKIRAVAAKSRSAGIHLVLATQRPSVDVITGTIKANLPSRIALKVTSAPDSQTILGEGGAEKLLGQGDMLYRNSEQADYERYQGAYISGREITNIVKYIAEHNKAYFDDEALEFVEKETRPSQESTQDAVGEGFVQKPLDDLFYKALWLAVNVGTISVSQIQRRFGVGWNRAGGVFDKMEMMGFLGPNQGGGKARPVVLSKDEYIERFGERSDDELY